MLGLFRGDDQNLHPLRRAAAQESDGGTEATLSDVRYWSAYDLSRNTADLVRLRFLPQLGQHRRVAGHSFDRCPHSQTTSIQRGNASKLLIEDGFGRCRYLSNEVSRRPYIVRQADRLTS